jgi:hypothetical protein
MSSRIANRFTSTSAPVRDYLEHMSTKVLLVLALAAAACGGQPAEPAQPQQPPPAATGDQDEVASKLGAARSAAAERRWNDALVLVDEILAVDPDNAEAKELGATAIRERDKPAAAEDELEDEIEDGVEGDVEGGVVGGVLGGVGSAPPPPPPTGSPKIVPAVALEQQRLAGNKAIAPPDPVKQQVAADGKQRLVAVVKLCIDDTGEPESTKMMKSSGYPAYDGRLQLEIMTRWRYRPFKVNGRAVPVCTAITFIYRQTP